MIDPPNSDMVCTDVSLSFGGTRALDRVSVRFQRREITAIIGPNGAGKTTLVDVLTGFTRPNAGSRELDGTDITSLNAYRTARLGIVRSFQELRLIYDMPVLDNVLLALPREREKALQYVGRQSSRGSKDESLTAIGLSFLTAVGLAPRAFERPRNLSYGQQKLLSLACCLATGASFFFLDEPAAGLDPESLSKVSEIIRNLRVHGAAVVFVEHDLGTVRELADRVIVMDVGRLVTEGTPSAVFNQSQIMDVFFG